MVQWSRSEKCAVMPNTNRNRDGSDCDENHFEPRFTPPFPQAPIEDTASEGRVPPQQESGLITTVKWGVGFEQCWVEEEKEGG